MALYRNTNSSGIMESVEFTPVAEGNIAFFYGRSKADAHVLKAQIQEIGQEILGFTQLGDKPVWITRGVASRQDVVRTLEERGERLTVPQEKQAFKPWVLRGTFSDIGQGFNLASSLKTVLKTGKGLDAPKLMFAALNLSANWVNKTFGAQKEEDVHHLHLLKGQVNTALESYLPAGVAPLAIDADRARLREGPPKPQTLGDKFKDFMKRNSVTIGEIGLRYLGSIFAVLSIPQLQTMGRGGGKQFKWGAALESMRKEGPKTAFGLLNEDPTMRNTGLIYLAGKSLGLLFAKIPDPYNPKKKTAFDTFREKYAFRISSLIETAAAATLAIGSARKKDPLGTIGGASLVAGLVTRFFAPFGIRQLDKTEVFAHAVDTIALVEPERRAESLAKAAALLQANFKQSPETYGEVYTALKDQLYHDRGIALFDTASPAAPQQEAAGENHAAKLGPREPTHLGRLQQVPQPAMGHGY